MQCAKDANTPGHAGTYWTNSGPAPAPPLPHALPACLASLAFLFSIALRLASSFSFCSNVS